MKTQKTIGIIGIVVGLALCGATTSHAALRNDVTGTWTGKGTCHGFDPTLPKSGKFTLSTTMTLVIQGGLDILNMSASDPFAGTYSGHVLRSANVPTMPQAAILSCDTAVSTASGHLFDAQFTLKSDAKGVDKSKMKATSIYSVLPGAVATCKWTFKRTSTDSVDVGGCTP